MNDSILVRFLLLVLLASTPSFAASRGIVIKPDEDGSYSYTEDFNTMAYAYDTTYEHHKNAFFNGATFAKDAFLNNITRESVKRGSVINAGPSRNRMLTYRFYGDRIIADVDVKIEQRANGPTLSGKNLLYLSVNGVDWTLVANSENQKPDDKGWQNEPLTVSADQIKQFIGQSELWVRIVLDNTTGKKTETSNYIDSFELKLKVTDEIGSQPAGQIAWGKLRQKADAGYITLDWADPIDYRPPHYYEDSDGWLQQAGVNPYLASDESEGFTIHREYHEKIRLPISLASFVKLESPANQMIARIVVQSSLDSSRKMKVLFDGQLLDTFDTRSLFDEKVFFVRIPSPKARGVYELRVTTDDRYPILIKQITVIANQPLRWSEKPALPKDGSLELLSAYYMPDPEPIAGSQVVEGRHESRPTGLTFRPLQRLYEEYADFGGMRVVVRNNSKVPVRIGNTLLFNGKSIEQSYIDFAKDQWDARGVIWYRVRPRLVEPGRCSQVYIRFRRRPAGENVTITIPLENGKPLQVTVPYTNPDFIIDYVTAGKSTDMLYVYARRSASHDVGQVTSLTLDGKVLKDAKIYGSDFPGNVALIVAKSPEPLKLGDYHVVGVKTSNNKLVHAQFRVLLFWFPRSSIYASAKWCAKMHMNTLTWTSADLATCEKYDIYGSATRGPVFDLHQRTAYIFSHDEPDAHDARGGPRNEPVPERYARGLGWRARMLARAGWQELIERHSPQAATWIVLNGTTRPIHWSVYGQLADICSTDPYPICSYDADHTIVRESLIMARKNSTPKRMYAIVEAFSEGGERYPTPAEYRQNVIQAIGSGAKGLTSWVTFHHYGGWEKNEMLIEAITNLNRLIEHIEDKLLIGTVIDLATSDAGLVVTGNTQEKKWLKDRVWTASLLCGPDTIIVAAANHIPASKPEPPTIEPTKDVTITVKLPDFLPDVEAFEVTENGITSFDCTTADGKVTLKLASIESGRVFLLRRK